MVVLSISQLRANWAEVGEMSELVAKEFFDQRVTVSVFDTVMHGFISRVGISVMVEGVEVFYLEYKDNGEGYLLSEFT